MIIGITGTYASGKDTVAEILEEMNFYHVSFSDLLRDELEKQKKPITRDTLIQFGNELRTKHGADILAQIALGRLEDGENFVFTSIRNPKEVELLQQRKDFLLVAVTTPANIRLERLRSRKRENDPDTLEELQKKESLENTSNPNAQQLQKVIGMAKIIINNTSTKEALQEKVKKLIQENMYKLQEPRPDWDHYFMNITQQVKIRASCLSAKKGAILVKDKMIISTGYNGTPKGMMHCTSGGCLRCTSRHLGKIKSGSYSEPCICVHSEENAIVQAAYNGISTKGAVMYSTFTPCTSCAKMIINAGITEVITKTIYPDDIGTKLLVDAKIKLRLLK